MAVLNASYEDLEGLLADLPTPTRKLRNVLYLATDDGASPGTWYHCDGVAWKTLGGGAGGPVAAEDVTVDSATLVGTGTDAQAVLEELDNAIADHLADGTGAHAASAIENTPAGSIAGTTVQDAINELDTEKAAVSHAHAGADITSGTVAIARLPVDTDGTLAGNSDSFVPTQKAVKTYADQLIASADAMVFKGVIDCSANPNYPAADRGHTYRVSVAGKIGGASGANVEVGDLLLCLTDGTASGTQAGVGASWSIAQSNLDGAVIGPASAVGDQLVSFSGTSGKLVQDSGLAVDTDGTLGANSDAKIASQKAVRTYTAAQLAALASVYQAKDLSLDYFAALDPAANVKTILEAANYAAVRSALGLVIGTDVQAYDARLTTWATLDPSAFFQTLIDDADAATARATLGLGPGKLQNYLPESVFANCLAESFPRGWINTNGSLLSTARLSSALITVPANTPCQKVGFLSATTAFSAAANLWFALCDASYNVIRQSTDQLAGTAWAANAPLLLDVDSIPVTAGARVASSTVTLTIPTLSESLASLVAPGDSIVVSNANIAAYNGTFTVVTVTSTQITYVSGGSATDSLVAPFPTVKLAAGKRIYTPAAETKLYAICMAKGTVPTLACFNGLAGANAVAPVKVSSGDTGLTGTCPSPIAHATGAAIVPYAGIT